MNTPLGEVSKDGSLSRTGGINRRAFLRSMGVGASAMLGTSLLAACGSSGAKSGGSTSTSSTGQSSASTSRATVSYGNDETSPGAIKAWHAVIDAFNKSTASDQAAFSQLARNTLTTNLTTWLQGNPTDTFHWFMGLRSYTLAQKKLIAPVDDAWPSIKKFYSAEFAKELTSPDGHMYFIPFYMSPWAVYYRKSVFAKYGYTVPSNWDSFVALCKQMKKDKLIPLGMADKGGWGALGTFDYIDMRLNGYKSHMDLMQHRQSWNQPKVKQIFDKWAEIAPFQQSGALGRDYTEIFTDLANKTVGMMVQEAGFASQFLKGSTLADVDFFPFPEINPQYGFEAVEAPVDGLCVTSATGSKVPGVKNFLEFVGSGVAQDVYVSALPGFVPTASNIDKTNYTPLMKKSLDVISRSKYISQFADRDALPVFATTVLEPAVQTWLRTGNFDYASVESQATHLYANS